MRGNQLAKDHHRPRLRATRIATLAAVLLLHLGLLALLLAPSTWRTAPPSAAITAMDALQVRLLSPPIRPVAAPPQAPVRKAVRRARPVSRPAPMAQQAPSPPVMPRAIDRRVVAAPPRYIAGGGQLAGPAYGKQNLRLPGRDAPLPGMPTFRMVDPRQQGLAGVVRFIGRLTGAVDPHCLDLERARGMTPRERIERHVDGDEARMAATAARYRYPDPLPPGAAMYYFTH